MTGHYGPEEWWYADGASAANVRAAVFEGDQSTLASIFSDAGLTVALPNPTTTDGSGVLEFYAVDGDYWIFVGDEHYGDSVLANLSPPVTGTGGALLISNNLSDLSNVVTARSNLGLGTAAVANTGIGPTNVILGNDSRLTDSRTPTAHAATHGIAGSDPVTIAESQVTNLVADLGNKQPLDADLTAIAALTPANDDIIQRKAGVWTNRTVAQYKTDLAFTAVDVGAQPIATIDAKGDLYAGTGDNATARRSVGVDGQVLTADSGDPTGLSWSSPGTDPNAQSRLVIDAKGDLYAGTGNDATTRLPVGTDGQALRANSATGTGLEWDTLTAGDVGADPAGSAAAAQAASQPVDADLTAIAALTPANDDIIQRKAGVWTNRTVAQYKVDQAYTPAEIGAVPTSRTLTAGTAMTGGGDLSADRTFNVNIGTAAGTAAAGDDSRITGAQQRSVIDAKGDIYVGTANDTTTRLPVGTDGQALRANSATGTGLEWDTLTAGDVGADPAGSAAAAQAASQPLDSDLTAIAALTPTNDDIIQRKAGVWTNRTMAQVKTDLAITASDVGAQPISTIDAKGDLYVGTGDNTTTRRAVGSNGQVLTADSAQADGVKWAAATDSGAVPKSTVTTKGDLIVATASATVARQGVGTDGQVLTADSAQTNGIKWAAAPVDTGAQQRSTLTTKGDLYVATASATTTRQGVGTNGYTLIADSAQTNGMKWATEKSFAFMPRSTGYISANGVATARSSKAATLNTMFLIPFTLLIDATTSSIAFEITGNVATAVVRLGFYALDSTTLLPTGAAVVDFGTTTADTTSTKTFAAVQALTAGGWALAFVAQTAAPTIRHCAGFNPFVASATFPAGTGLGWNNGWAQTGVTGGLPTIGTITDTDTPMCGIKF